MYETERKHIGTHSLDISPAGLTAALVLEEATEDLPYCLLRSLTDEDILSPECERCKHLWAGGCRGLTGICCFLVENLKLPVRAAAGWPLGVAVVCSSTQTRSVEAHKILNKRGFSFRSFGTGTHVKLPGPAPDKPNVYDFRTTYDQVYNDLLRKDKELYTQNGILHMLDRNKRIKPRPERFQDCRDLFDLILPCEERVYDQVVEDLNSREQETCQPVHVVNVDIQDNHEEATLGAFLICELCQCIQHTEDMENEVDELLQEFEEKSGRAFPHTVGFY
ncbi:RNA polymerase II subunit A C-terminal domain phosphatase SSU72-like [Vulpes lagopus]|uniref:RNA polymerase II subunit A C-terminal domain phosphatase SSU72-like n=1 Tax=Vulpes lagopus TaxID=494514 RepID=UPI001BCA4514|nr:RNA polymerase II subunit A C-terminal domain phosphatase SSU72-like [Vulpes lagopus]